MERSEGSWVDEEDEEDTERGWSPLEDARERKGAGGEVGEVEGEEGVGECTEL